jgi:hypothetical protein
VASMEGGSWAEIEFDEADLGDRRLSARLIDLAGRLAEEPSQSLPEACADGAQLKAAYRFFSNEKVTPSPILASHVRSTQARIEAESVVLAVQDTTSLDYTAHPATTGLGVLNDVKHQGFLVHTTLAITPERVPLGPLAQEVWTREAASLGKRKTRKQRPITEKESQQWLTSLEAVKALHARCPSTRTNGRPCTASSTVPLPHPRRPQRCAKPSAGSPNSVASSPEPPMASRARSPSGVASTTSLTIPPCFASCVLPILQTYG